MASYVEQYTELELRIVEKAKAENHEWRWAPWASHPRTVGDMIEVRDKGHIVWTELAVSDYLNEEASA